MIALFITLLRVILVVVLALLQYELWYGENGFLAKHAREARLAELSEQNEALRARNERLRQEIAELSEGGEALEEVVRRSYNWVAPDEILFVLPEEPYEAGSSRRSAWR